MLGHDLQHRPVCAIVQALRPGEAARVHSDHPVGPRWVLPPRVGCVRMGQKGQWTTIGWCGWARQHAPAPDSSQESPQ